MPEPSTHAAVGADADQTAMHRPAKARLAHRIFGVATVVAAIGFVYANRSDIPLARRAIREANLCWLLAGLGASFAFLGAQSFARRSTLRAFGVSLSIPRSLVLGAVAHSLNVLAKSGGMAGAVVYREEARRTGQQPSLALGGYMLGVLLGDVAFCVTLLASFVLLLVDGRLTRGDLVALAVFAIYLLVVGGLVIAAAHSRQAVRRMHAIPARWRRREPDHTAADEIFDAMQEIREYPRAVLPGLLWMLIIEVLGVAMVWLSLAAFGHRSSLTVAIVGYGISVLFSVVGFMPAGIGFAEASLGAVIVSFDVPVAVAAVAVIAYRIFETWLPLVVGLLATRWWRRGATLQGA